MLHLFIIPHVQTQSHRVCSSYVILLWLMLPRDHFVSRFFFKSRGRNCVRYSTLMFDISYPLTKQEFVREIKANLHLDDRSTPFKTICLVLMVPEAQSRNDNAHFNEAWQRKSIGKYKHGQRVVFGSVNILATRSWGLWKYA
jgi:hypothetical protein